jgi:hypothetical protein
MGKRNSGDRWEEKNDMPLDHKSDSWRRGVAGAVDGGTGRYTDNDVSFLVRKPSDTPRDDPTSSKDIFDEVCSQDSDSGNRAVRSGKL